VGDELVLTWVPATRAAHVLPAAVADAARRCAGFETLARHVADRCREQGLGPEASGALQAQLVESGLLVSWADVMQRCRAAAEPGDATIGCLGLLTTDRVELLERALDSYLANVRRSGRSPEVVVIDQSRQPAHRDGTRRAARMAGARHGLDVFYAGHDERDAFTAALARAASVPAELVRFALIGDDAPGMTAGAGRNAMLLHAAGGMLFSADDDTVCRIARPPDGDDGLDLVDEPNPTEFWFYPERGAALRALGEEDEDLLGLHERLLGQSPARCVARLSHGLEPGVVSRRFVEALMTGRGRVRVTLNGLLGDPGMGSASSLLALRGPSRSRLLASETTYRAALNRCDVLRVARRASISPGGFCMAGFIGLDHRELLPPFFPVLRNEDGVFGAVLSAAFEGAGTGFLPRALLHAPGGPRTFPPATARSVGLSQVVIGGIADWTGQRGGDRERLVALGRHLEDLGDLPRPEFEERVRLTLWRQTSSLAGALEGLLQSSDAAPAAWVEDVERALEQLACTVVSEDFAHPVDLAAGRGPEEVQRLTARLVGRFGRLLQAWPALVDAARELRARGNRPGVPA
jgi:hypothetical protein